MPILRRWRVSRESCGDSYPPLPADPMGICGSCLQGIRSGTDPTHAEYWGKVNDYDQRLVEMAVFGLAFALIPERIWRTAEREGEDQPLPVARSDQLSPLS